MRVKPPLWFTIVSVVLVLWGLVGLFGFVAELAMSPADAARADAFDQQFRITRPMWFMPLYGFAVGTGLAGQIALLLRRRSAHPLFVVSLVAVVLMFGWMFVATDLIPAKGAATAMTLPIIIAVIGAFEIWLAGLARQRGWIG